MDTQANTDIFKNIDNYREFLLISNVIDYFGKQNILFTKNTIQNYLKINILPPLHNKKYYTRKHLYFLYFISLYRELYSLEEIGKMLFTIDEKEGIINFYNKYINNLDTLYSFSNEFEKNIIDLGNNLFDNSELSKLLLLGHFSNMKKNF